jgi:hypothetical protein
LRLPLTSSSTSTSKGTSLVTLESIAAFIFIYSA